MAKAFLPAIAMKSGVDENERYLMDELVRIKRLEYFVDKFEEEVQMRGAETAGMTIYLQICTL